MRLIDRLATVFLGRDQSVASRGELVAFMDSRAAFLAQKCIVEFCRVRAGVYWQKLFSEAEFRSELNRSTWRAYPQTFSMVAEMVEATLREHAGLRQRQLPDALSVIGAEVFAKYPVPDGEAPGFWKNAEELLRQRLAATQGAAPRPVREMPAPGARGVFDVLPIHKDIVTRDYDYIFNNLRMNLLRAHEDLAKGLKPDDVVNDLLDR